MLKVTVTEPQNEWVFPCWGKHCKTDLVVRFTSSKIGTVEVAGGNWVYEQSSYTWDMSEFEPCPNPFEKKVEDKDKEIEFPCLMIDKNNKIYQVNQIKDDFIKGIMVFDPTNKFKTIYSGSFKNDELKPFNGEITIKNG